MARVTVEDCLERVDNRFALVVMGTQRARNLRKGDVRLFDSKNKEPVHALREIAAGFVDFREGSKKRLSVAIRGTEQYPSLEEELPAG